MAVSGRPALICGIQTLRLRQSSAMAVSGRPCTDLRYPDVEGETVLGYGGLWSPCTDLRYPDVEGETVLGYGGLRSSLGVQLGTGRPEPVEQLGPVPAVVTFRRLQDQTTHEGNAVTFVRTAKDLFSHTEANLI